jgi:hypothetical protein
VRARLLRELARRRELLEAFELEPGEVLAPRVMFRGRPVTPEEAHAELARYFAP